MIRQKDCLMIDKELIKQRKTQYGSNFDAISSRFSKYLKKEISNADVCSLMALMKEARIEAITKKIEYFSTHFNIDVSENATTLEELELSLEDSINDRDNYNFISENYQGYLGL